MRLAGPPSEATLARLYHELSRLGARAIGERAEWEYGEPGPEQLVVLASQVARYDPRVLWVLVEYLARRAASLNPSELRSRLRESRWPAALGVAFEFARRVDRSQEMKDVEDFVMRRVPRAAGEQFFLSTHAFAGALARREAEESLAEYKRWGFFSREQPLSKELGATAGTMGRSERINLLRRLVERRGSITLGEYVAALEGRASVRQASRDLASAEFLSRRGTTRAARYSLRRRRPGAPAPKVGQKVRLTVSGRTLSGVVTGDRGPLGGGGSRMVRVAIRDPLGSDERYEVEVPSDWTS